MKLGPTGTWPKGMLNSDDAGGLNMAITHEGNNIIINFGTPVAWLGLPKDQVIEFARLLLKHAGARKVDIEL